jgi:non-ribosomal peptide synthetase component F
MFTSGTTGDPKCILGTHRPLSHFIDWHVGEFGLRPADRFSMLSGLAHDPLLRDIFTPLWLGATLCIPNPDDMLSPGWLRTWMQKRQISVAHLTPALSAVLLEPSFGRRETRTGRIGYSRSATLSSGATY